MTALHAMRKRMKDDGIEFILAQFVDIHGAAKAKMLPAAELEAVTESGAGFAGGAVWGAGQGPDAHDMLARVDLDTYTPLSWMPNTARFAASLFVDGEPHPHCARTNLIRVLDEVRSQGYEFLVGMEPEHFLVTRREDGSIGVWDPETIDSLSKPYILKDRILLFKKRPDPFGQS